MNTNLYDSFINRKVIKVICGLQNTNISNIIQVVKAAELAGATYIDIVANTKIVSIIKSLTYLPICVSSINPIDLYNCSLMGAQIVELGNFDIFYDKNIQFSQEYILDLAYETRSLIPNKDICVTIPHTLNLYEQVTLARSLENIGINMIQTEGYMSKINIQSDFKKYINMKSNFDMVSQATYYSAATLSSTLVIANSVDIPVITASSLNDLSSVIAFNYGASGIGIGSCINSMNNIYDMSDLLSEIKYSINNNSVSNKIYIANSYDKLINMNSII
uniref:Uncharacterized protein ycf23 n=1 Tax=Wrangelia sp. TaxID=2575620 RepID=A0A4D6X2F6_9FLOR|nr:hypothetical protein [Wrangelia sp.]